MEKPSMIWRVLHLMLTIDRSPGLSAKELAARCEISERSVYRYLELLEMAGVALSRDKGYRLVSEPTLGSVNLTLPEAVAVVLAGRHFAGGKTPFGPSLTQALHKILAVVPDDLRRAVAAAKQRVLTGGEGPVDYAGSERCFRLIEGAITNHQTLRLNYRGLSTDRPRRRLIDPYGVVSRQGLWYVVAYCHKRKEERLFRLDRMLAMEPSGESFTPRPDFSLTEYMKNAWHVERGEPREVKVRFTGVAKRVVLEGSWHPSQRVVEDDGDEAVVCFEVGGLRELAAWLMGFAGEAVAMEPPELRRLVAHMGRLAAEAHQ